MPPMTKNAIALTPYMMPSFLWSTVKNHARQPVVDTGRRNTPSDVDGVTSAGARSAVAGMGRSMMAMAQCRSRR